MLVGDLTSFAPQREDFAQLPKCQLAAEVVLLRIFELFKLLIGQGCKPCLSISYDFLEDSLCLPGLGVAEC
jgi:hypothetical protein